MAIEGILFSGNEDQNENIMHHYIRSIQQWLFTDNLLWHDDCLESFDLNLLESVLYRDYIDLYGSRQ